MARLLSLILLGIYATNAVSQPDTVEELIQRLVAELSELRGSVRAEQELVARGLSAEDADRQVHGLLEGLVRCLVDEARTASEERAESFADKLPLMHQSLDRSGPMPLFRDLALAAEARGPDSEACALNELQKAGIGMDVLDDAAAEVSGC